MLWFGKEVPSMMAKSMVRNNIKRTPMIFKLMVRNKKLLLTLEFHMLQPSSKLEKWVDHQFQVLHLSQTLVFHTSRELLTTQVLQAWTQMPPFGRELLSMTAKFTVRNNTKRMPTIFKLTEKLKRLLLTQEFHMHLPSSRLVKWVDHQSQVPHLSQTLVSHTSKVLPTTQEHHQWTQMPLSGREELSMTARFTVKNNTKRMQMISKPTVRHKKLLLIPESHMPQPLSKQSQSKLMPVKCSNLSVKFH
jgi:hypothetical protein